MRGGKHGRGVLATAPSPGSQRCLGRAARFRVVRWLRSQGKQRQRPAGTRPARARAGAALPLRTPRRLAGRRADPRCHLREVLDLFLRSRPSHSCTETLDVNVKTAEQLCPAPLCPSHAPCPASRAQTKGHGGSSSDRHSSGPLSERGQRCQPLQENSGTGTFAQTNSSKNNLLFKNKQTENK